MAIFNANLEVTKATVQGGEIKDLEINRQNVPLASSVKLETNKAQTIDVSAYSDPVEITPTTGKDAMKKATVTLSNIHNKLYAWVSADDAVIYTVEAEPTTSSDAYLASDTGLSEITLTSAGTSAITAEIEEIETSFSRTIASDIEL